jgi:hypothetical protein
VTPSGLRVVEMAKGETPNALQAVTETHLLFSQGEGP